MDNKIEIKENRLTVIPQGLDKMWSFKDKIEIPLDHILGATIDNTILNTSKGFRGPGLGMPNKWSGTWTMDGEKHFWNVSRKETPLVIQLKDEKYARLVIGVDHAKEWTDYINNLVSR